LILVRTRNFPHSGIHWVFHSIGKSRVQTSLYAIITVIHEVSGPVVQQVNIDGFSEL